jgi:hypothetical protein
MTTEVLGFNLAGAVFLVVGAEVLVRGASVLPRPLVFLPWLLVLTWSLSAPVLRNAQSACGPV